ncbi:hypothetical protein Tco_0755878 [Tanacetum coccineum]
MESVKKSIDERAQHKRGEMTAGRELKKIQTEERRKKVVGQALMWKPTGKIFKTIGLRWVPTGKIFTSSTTKVDSEPTNGSNDDIINQFQSFNHYKGRTPSSELGIHDHSNELSSSKLVPKVVPPAAQGHLHHVTSWNYSFSINITMLKMELVMPIPAKDGIHYNMRSRYQVYQGRLLASFQDDAKYEHVGQDTRRIAMVAESAHVGKDKDLKI